MSFTPISLSANGQAMAPADLGKLDDHTGRAVNGDGGGTYAPSAPIVVNGAGVWLVAYSPISGGAIAQTGGGSGADPFVFGDDDYFLLKSGHTGASRVIYESIERARGPAGFAKPVGTTGLQICSIFGGAGARFAVPLKPHNGASLTTVSFGLIVGGIARAAFPLMPRFRVVRVSRAGVKEPMKSTSSGADPNGWIAYPVPGSLATYNANTLKTFAYTCDRFIIIDTSRYTYLAEVTDEAGVNAAIGNLYQRVASTNASILDMRPS